MLIELNFDVITKFKGKYRIESSRNPNWDYGWDGAYFITICTANRERYFGNVINRSMNLNDIGELANKFWMEIPAHFPFVKLDAFVVMPDHVHGIIISNKKFQTFENSDAKNNTDTRQCIVSCNPTNNSDPQTKSITPAQKRFRNQGKNTISSIVGSYKSVVTKNARKILDEFSWQSRFHDYIIRNKDEFLRIQKYIIDNPSKWKSNSLTSNI